MTCDRKICYQQDYNGGCETCPCNELEDVPPEDLDLAKEAVRRAREREDIHED